MAALLTPFAAGVAGGFVYQSQSWLNVRAGHSRRSRGRSHDERILLIFVGRPDMSIKSLARRVPRPQLSYANVASTAALVLALGTGTAYAANTVFSTDIVDGQVMNADLATNAVNTGKIINGGVWGQDIKADAITSSLVADGTLTGADLAADAVGNAQLADSSVGSAEVQNESLTSNDLAADSVQASEIADNSIDGGEIVNDSLGSNDLAPGSVGTSEVSDGSLTGSDIANDGLTMSDISGGGTSGGTVSFPAIATGHCNTYSVGIAGATAGDAAVITAKAAMPAGTYMYATQVSASNTVAIVYCNLSGATSPVVSSLPVRIVTFH
jgi:hypothetical protein